MDTNLLVQGRPLHYDNADVSSASRASGLRRIQSDTYHCSEEIVRHVNGELCYAGRSIATVGVGELHEIGGLRASIGHEGLGFKLVLEIAEAPEALRAAGG